MVRLVSCRTGRTTGAWKASTTVVVTTMKAKTRNTVDFMVVVLGFYFLLLSCLWKENERFYVDWRSADLLYEFLLPNDTVLIFGFVDGLLMRVYSSSHVLR